MKNFYVNIILLAIFANHVSANECSGKIGGFVPNPDDCTKFYVCVFFVPFSRSCDENEIFDAERLECVSGDPSLCRSGAETTEFVPYNTTILPDTTMSTVPQPIDTTTTIPRTTIPPPNIADICSGVFFSARPHPTNQELYIGCMRGDGLILQCFLNEVFDRKLNECVEKCEVSENICAGITFEVIANPCDCLTFFICYDGTKIAGECRENEVFDSNSRL